MTPYLRSALYVVLILIAGFVVVSVFDIVVSVMNSRKYSLLFFVVVFGMAGIFASLQAYAAGYKALKGKTEKAHAFTFLVILATSLIFFFLLAMLEGGEYGTAFRSYSVMTAISGFLWMRLKIDF